MSVNTVMTSEEGAEETVITKMSILTAMTAEEGVEGIPEAMTEGTMTTTAIMKWNTTIIWNWIVVQFENGKMSLKMQTVREVQSLQRNR